MTENELVAACLTQNRLAQRMLYDRYKTAMYTLAYRITADFDEANDVLQDAFLDVFRTLENFRGEATLGAWIKTIIVRKAYKKLRKTHFLEYRDEFSEAETGSIEGIEKLDSEYLEKVILSLPDGYRAVFIMIEVEGFSHKETAQVLGISEGTTKSQLFHSKRKLRKILTHFE